MFNIFSFTKRQYQKFILIPLSQRKLKNISILDSFSSIQYIIDNKCSVSRFGDGEFDVLMGKDGNTFQKANPVLAEKLKKVLINDDAPDHVIGIPLPLKDTSKLRPSSRDFWGYYTLQYIEKLLPYLSQKKVYLDTQLSRFYMMYKDRSHSAVQLQLMKRIWEDRDIVIVEGDQSRTGVGNDLYNNAKSIKRILGPSTNAFAKYDDMLNAIIKYAPKGHLIILSYGMCATVLAYELSKQGYQAIDLGHLDIEYEWMKMGAIDNVPVVGKFTNEAGDIGRNDVQNCNDAKYFCQIIIDITKC